MNVAQLVEPRVVIPVVVGSSPIVHPIFQRVLTGHRVFGVGWHIQSVVCRFEPSEPLAQLVEQWTLNPLVRGSSPRGPTKVQVFSDQVERCLSIRLRSAFLLRCTSCRVLDHNPAGSDLDDAVVIADGERSLG